MIARWVAGFLILGSSLFYFTGQPRNPPGFFHDESSIAYNSLQIARTGTDEHGVPFPLFFRAFDEYKNPVYIYLLAGVLKVIGPSDLAARRFSAVCGFTAAAALSLLAWRTSRSRIVTAATFLTALSTPLLFELSRVVFEVSLYPLVTAVFLITVHWASQRERWGAPELVAVTTSLILLAYTYSIGRLLAPLLAMAFARVFYTRERRAAVAAILASFTLLVIVPIAVFNRFHDDALTRRFLSLTYVGSAGTPWLEVAEMARHFGINLDPIGMSFLGDANPRHHVAGSGGGILMMTYVLAAIGAVLASRRKERWWTFVLIGTLLSIVPASLTVDPRHALRLAPYPVFLITLSIPAIEWLLRRRRIAAGAIAAGGVIQVLWFFAVFHRDGPKRRDVFESGARTVVDAALDTGKRPIHAPSSLAYIHVYWYAAQRGVAANAIVHGRSGEPGSVHFTDRDPPPRATVISRDGEFSAFIIPGN